MMKKQWLIRFYVHLLLAANLAVCEVLGNCRLLQFTHVIKGAALQHHVIITFTSSSEHSCRIQCYLENFCVSYNYGKTNSGEEICVLNNSTATENPFDLERNPSFIYQGAKNSCSSMPCLNDGTCHSGFPPSGYRCLCTTGFTGIQCDTDINECTSNPCLNGGTCSNHVGGFNCNCPVGFIGTQCQKAAPECRNYITLNNEDRNRNYINYGKGKCDSNLKEDWYRFGGLAGKQLATECVTTHRCGTDLTGWMDGNHPTVDDGIVQTKVCFHGWYNCCYIKTTINVRNCGEYFVYRLKKVGFCNARYCGSD